MKKIIFSLLSVSLFTGCTQTQLQMTPNMGTTRYLSAEDKKQKRTLQVFFDGTANKWSSRTNVRRRFEVVAAAEDPAAPCLYVDGVGNDSLTGKILGVGMKSRVLAGYKFIAQQWYNSNDEIRVFGFSRGAFQARVMVGMMAHCGVPDAGSVNAQDLDRALDDIWDYSRKHLLDADDGSSVAKWSATLAANQEHVQSFIAAKYPGIRFHQPRIHFLGLWDTVPGLQFSKIKDDTNMRTKDSGQRYKVRPYPNVDIIAQALALDEKRKQFRPLLVGPPLDPGKTKVYEVWFPGAHSDIGGGYEDSNDMAGITFNWIDSIMKKHNITTRVTNVYADATSIQHHPEEVFPINVGGRYNRALPVGSVIDRTVFTRATNEAVPNKNSGMGEGAFKKYSPEIPLLDGSFVHIESARTTAERNRILQGKLKLNDSEESPASQKALGGKPLRMDQMFAAPSADAEPQGEAPPKDTAAPVKAGS